MGAVKHADLIAEARQRMGDSDVYAFDREMLHRLATALEGAAEAWMVERVERLEAEIEAYGEGRMSRGEHDAKCREIIALRAALDAARKGGGDAQ